MRPTPRSLRHQREYLTWLSALDGLERAAGSVDHARDTSLGRPSWCPIKPPTFPQASSSAGWPRFHLGDSRMDERHGKSEPQVPSPRCPVELPALPQALDQRHKLLCHLGVHLALERDDRLGKVGEVRPASGQPTHCRWKARALSAAYSPTPFPPR